MGFSYPDPLAFQTHWQNLDTLTKSRPTVKIQTHWLGLKVVHIVTRNIQKLKSCFHQYFIYIHNFIKTMAGDTAGVTTQGVVPHTLVKQTVFS